jgi:hypothetical protein
MEADLIQIAANGKQDIEVIVRVNSDRIELGCDRFQDSHPCVTFRLGLVQAL